MNAHRPRKDRALVLILALAILLMVTLLATMFLAIADVATVVKNEKVYALRVELLTKSAQSVARMWINNAPIDTVQWLQNREMNERPFAYGGVSLSGQPVPPATRGLHFHRVQTMTTLPSFFESPNGVREDFAYIGSSFGRSPIEQSTAPSFGSEVFDDSGIQIEDSEVVGAGDGSFSFLDVGEDGDPETEDKGEGNGVHDPGEPSEPFSDVNGNGRHDAYTGALGASLAEFSDHYRIRILDTQGMVYVNGGEPVNSTMPLNYPEVDVLYGDGSLSYKTSVVNLPTIKLLNNLGIILSRVPPRSGQIHDSGDDKRWFNRLGIPEGLWTRTQGDAPPRPIFGLASQDKDIRNQLVHNEELVPISELGLGDIIVQARPEGGYSSIEEVGKILVSEEGSPLLLEEQFKTILSDVLAVNAWVDDTTVVAAKFWNPYASESDKISAPYKRVMELDHPDAMVEVDDPGAPNPDIDVIFLKNSSFSPSSSRVFAGATAGKDSTRLLKRTIGHNWRTLPLVPGRWDAGFDRDTEKDNLFGVVPEKRAPINLNTASPAVLEAVFMGLEASFVTDRENNLWPLLDNETYSETQFSTYTDSGGGEGGDLHGQDPRYLAVWHAAFFNNYTPQSGWFPEAGQSDVFFHDPQNYFKNGITKRGGFEVSEFMVNSSVFRWAPDLSRDWYRVNPTIAKTMSVVIYPVEAHELAVAIDAYRRGLGFFADVGIDGRAGIPEFDLEDTGADNGRLDYNEDYAYTAIRKSDIAIHPGARYSRSDFVPLGEEQTFRSWEQFLTFLDSVKTRAFRDQTTFGLTARNDFLVQQLMIADLKVDLIFANCNPNANLLRFNPNASFASFNRRRYDGKQAADYIVRRIDKFDLFTPGENYDELGKRHWLFDPGIDHFDPTRDDLNGNGLFDTGGRPTHTTDLIFENGGRYTIETLGILVDHDGAVVAHSWIRSTIQISEQVVLRTQRDFDGALHPDDVDRRDETGSTDWRRTARDIPTSEVDMKSRLVTLPEFDSLSWLPAYQMSYEEEVILSADGVAPEKVGTKVNVWRWLKNGAQNFDRGPGGTFLKTASALYDGQIVLPTYFITPDAFETKATTGNENVFKLRFYSRFSSAMEGSSTWHLNDDLNAWFYGNRAEHRVGFRLVADNAPPGLRQLPPKWDHGFSQKYGTTGASSLSTSEATDPSVDQSTGGSVLNGSESTLWLRQQGLLEPQFWGLGGPNAQRIIAKRSVDGMVNLRDEAREVILDRLTKLFGKMPPIEIDRALTGFYDPWEWQAYRHWPKSMPQYDREGGLTPEGVYRVGIRNLIYDLRANVKDYAKQTTTNSLTQEDLPSIFEGENLYFSMWVKPNYSGSPHKGTLADDSAEQFIKPHRLPNPVVWAITASFNAHSIHGQFDRLVPQAYPPWAREVDSRLSSPIISMTRYEDIAGVRSVGIPKMANSWSQEEVPTAIGREDMLAYGQYEPFHFDKMGDKDGNWTFKAKELLPSVPPHRRHVNPTYRLKDERQTQLFPVWWRMTTNPVPPFQSYMMKLGNYRENGTFQKYAGPVYLTIPNLLFAVKTYNAQKKTVRGDGLELTDWQGYDDLGRQRVGQSLVVPEWEPESFSSIMLWHEIHSPVFNPRVNESARESGAVNVYGRQRTRDFLPKTAREMKDRSGRPLVAQFVRYGPIFKEIININTGSVPPWLVGTDIKLPGKKRNGGRYLHWSIYEPLAQHTQHSADGHLMRHGEWTKISYAIKGPKSSSQWGWGDLLQGYHKIWVFNRADLDTNHDLSGPQGDPKFRTPNDGWWINRPTVGLGDSGSGEERVLVGNPIAGGWPNWKAPNQWEAWRLEDDPRIGQFSRAEDTDNDGVVDEVYYTIFDYYPELINRWNGDTDPPTVVQGISTGLWPNPIGQDPAYIGRVDEVNLGPGFAGTIDEFKIYGSIPDDLTINPGGGHSLEDRRGGLETAPTERNRYYIGEATYISPRLNIPANAGVTHISWSQFIPDTLVHEPESGFEKETYLRFQILNTAGTEMIPNGPLEWLPRGSAVDFSSANLHVKITMKAGVNSFGDRDRIRSNRLLDTPVVSDIMIRYTIGKEQILLWEEF